MKEVLKDAANASMLGAGGAAVTKAALITSGFSSAGPIAGTIAAGIQAIIGNVAPGSAFATIQSVTMTPVLFGITVPVLIGGAAGVGDLCYIK